MPAFYKVAVLFLVAIVGLPICLDNSVDAQQSYRIISKTVYVQEPVKEYRWVNETVYEKQSVTSQKNVWQTENRVRTRTVRKPIQETTEREERVIVKKPITETKYREKRVEETSYEMVTELRDEEYTVRKPVTETSYRDEEVTVRKKVTEDVIEVQNVKRYRPVTVTETEYVPEEVCVTTTAKVNDSGARPRLKRLTAGYYTDPTTGQQVFRRGGLHWVQPSVDVVVADTVPVLVGREKEKTALVEETVQRRRPVELTRYEDRTETRRVPLEVERMVEETRTRRVPYTIKKPTTKVTIEQVPYTETTYVEEVQVKKVPVTTTVYQEEEIVEPYEVRVPRWVDIKEEVEVPKTVRRRQEYTVMRAVPRTVRMKVPIDECGEVIGPAVPLDAIDVSLQNSSGYGSSVAESTTTSRPTTSREPTPANDKTLDETSAPAGGFKYEGKWYVPAAPDAAKTLEETSARKKRSVLMPETVPNPQTSMKPIAPDPVTKDAGNAETQSNAELESAVADPFGEEATANTQGESEILSLPVGGRQDAEAVNASVPKAGQPDDVPVQSGDEYAAERSGEANAAVELNEAE